VLSRRWLVNFALLLAIAALVYAGLRLDAGSAPKSSPRVSTLRADAVDRIELQVGGLQLGLQRGDGGWRITAPIDWPAEDGNVERLLSIVKLEADPVAQAAEVDLRELGLQPPQATLRLNGTPLLFGATNNIGGRRYVLVESRLYLLPDTHLAFAAQGLLGIVDRRLLPDRADISALRLPGLEIVRDGGGQLRSTPEPGPTPARLERLLDGWQTLSASRILRLDPAAGAGEPIEVRFADGRRIDFRLLSTAPEIIIANPGIGLQYHFRASLAEQLLAPAGDG